MATGDGKEEDTITRVLELVAHLGGPSYSVHELEWAADIPAGKQLLEWLATQLPADNHSPMNPNTDSVIDTSISNFDKPTLQAGLAPIALYQDEVVRLESLGPQSLSETSGDQLQTLMLASHYQLPSQLRERAEIAQSEAELLEQQTEPLKHRLKASKAAAKGLKEAIQTLQQQIQASDDTIQDQQQRLSEISAQADDAITRHTNLALHTLGDAELSRTQPAIPDGYKSEIAALTASRTAVARTVKQLYRDLDNGYESLPVASELEHEASILHAKMREVTRSINADKLVETAYIEELGRMAKRLEGSDGTQELARIRDSAPETATEDSSTVKVDVDIKLELERGGRMDRLTLLAAQEKGLDAALNYMGDQLLPRLQQTYDNLQARSAFASEKEAIVSALIEELEDINDAVESAKRLTEPGDSNGESPEALLESDMITLLKGLLGGARSSVEGGTRPTVLLDRADLAAELSSLSQQLVASQQAEEKWSCGLRDRIADLSASTAPLLSAAYAYSPVNTSPPFAQSPEQVALLEGTRAKARELTDAAIRLQKEAELSSRDKRKLAAFVEKWVPR
ncbi:hypothetical protein C8Q80DRAFT_496992 [Daedaleopsis nitida]|nr:hypothetical protein C8Q80DRAFT_496992 [Daedaleopsis nitida]